MLIFHLFIRFLNLERFFFTENVFYRRLTGIKTLTLRRRKEEKALFESTARKSPIGSGQAEPGHSGIAAGRGALYLSSSLISGEAEQPVTSCDNVCMTHFLWA